MREGIREHALLHGTPLYLYDSGKIKANYEKVKSAFNSFEIIYSVKANPNRQVLELLLGQCAGIDAASKNEVLKCAGLGCLKSNIYYSAPGKKKSDIADSLGNSQIIADSLGELKLIDETAGRLDTVANVGVRLNIPQPALDGSYLEVMNGEESKFGIRTTDFFAAALEIKKCKNIRLNGLHVYFGSQIINPGIISANFKAISEAALSITEIFPIEYVNYGGGFGVADQNSSGLDLEKTAGLICSDDSTRAIIGKGIRRNLELGRFLVAEAGVFVASVIDVKRSGSVNFAILDGGMSSFYRPMFTNQKHRVTVVGKTQKNETRCAKSRGSENHEKGALKYRLVGNTCTPLDVIGDEELPALMAGDLLAFENAGAYGYSMSMLDFISFDRPKEIMI